MEKIGTYCGKEIFWLNFVDYETELPEGSWIFLTICNAQPDVSRFEKMARLAIQKGVVDFKGHGRYGEKLHDFFDEEMFELIVIEERADLEIMTTWHIDELLIYTFWQCFFMATIPASVDPDTVKIICTDLDGVNRIKELKSYIRYFEAGGLPPTGSFLYQDAVFDLITINTSLTCYYRLTHPQETQGNYQTQLAFYNKNNELIYHRKDTCAYGLINEGTVDFVRWSETEDLLFFHEFQKETTEGGYDYVVLDVLHDCHYRIDAKLPGEFPVTELKAGFSRDKVLEELEKACILPAANYHDKISTNPLNWLLKTERWLPLAKL